MKIKRICKTCGKERWIKTNCPFSKLIKCTVCLGRESDIIEDYVTQYGKKHRVLIQDSIDWLNENEDKWNLDKPIDQDKFIADMLGELDG